MQPEAAVLVDAVLEVAAGELGALEEADEPRARSWDLRHACGENRRRVAHFDREPLGGRALNDEVDRSGPGMLARVCEGLLDDP